MEENKKKRNDFKDLAIIFSSLIAITVGAWFITKDTQVEPTKQPEQLVVLKEHIVDNESWLQTFVVENQSSIAVKEIEFFVGEKTSEGETNLTKSVWKGTLEPGTTKEIIDIISGHPDSQYGAYISDVSFR